MGHWGGKAEGEWREVLELEPSHWQARFNLAVSLSYHPDVLTKTPESIGELTKLVEQQRDMTPEPRQADVYRLLALLHRRQGEADAAAQCLRLGLERHPEDEKLLKAVEALEDGR
jgi:tetratricopeptide (TPR) repeat protein